MKDNNELLCNFERLFVDALILAKSEFYVEAIEYFWKIVSSKSKGDLADDALCNISLCHFHLCQYHQAIATAKRLIDEYPNGKISELNAGIEIGYTSAKAHYILVQCHVKLGKLTDARNSYEALRDYSNSYVKQGNGERKTYLQLAEEILQQVNGSQ